MNRVGNNWRGLGALEGHYRLEAVIKRCLIVKKCIIEN